jgi:hypothetical protein
VKVSAKVVEGNRERTRLRRPDLLERDPEG